MMHDRILQTAGRGSVGAMKRGRYIAMHAVAAAAFMFLLQRYALNATLEASLSWALALGAGAAGLAYSQFNP